MIDIGFGTTETGGVAMTMLALIAMAGILSFFAFRTTQVMFRVGAAVAWLTVLLYVLASDKSVDISNPWTVSLFLCLFCAVVGVLLMYMGRTIENAWIRKKEPDIRRRDVMVKEDYRNKLRERLGRVDKGGYGGKIR